MLRKSCESMLRRARLLGDCFEDFKERLLGFWMPFQCFAAFWVDVSFKVSAVQSLSPAGRGSA